MASKTSHYYSIFTDTYQPNTGATIWHWRREVVSVYVIIMIPNDAVSHWLITSAAYEPAEK